MAVEIETHYASALISHFEANNLFVCFVRGKPPFAAISMNNRGAGRNQHSILLNSSQQMPTNVAGCFSPADI